MKVFLLGAGGFLGRHIAAALRARGHAVHEARRPETDLARDHDAGAWRSRVRGFDAAINAAGIFRERDGGTFEAIHVRGPLALFEACAAEGVAVVQVSALGADAGAASAFHRSKRAADEALVTLDVPSLVLQPSLVFGEDGASARLFATLAALPLIPVPGDGSQRVQPVHVDDVVEAIVIAVEASRHPRARLAAVGPRPLALREYLAALRAAMGLGRARFLPIPRALAAFAARRRVGLLDADTLAMLERGNAADAAPFAAWLGRAPRAVDGFIAPARRAALAREAKLGWLLPLLRLSVAFVWLTAAIVSAGIYPVDASLGLLRAVGLEGPLALAALYGAAALDFALGVATLAMKRRRALWSAQLALILAYTAIVTVFLPGQWLHPFGPVAKNLPMLAAILLLRELEAR